MAEADTMNIRRVPHAVTDPERIPTKRYYDEAFYRLENEHLWPHVWQFAARTEQLANVGDYVEYSNLGRSVIVVRAKDGIKAYHNACRHRGVQLARGSGNCKSQGFICPFHGWRWNIEGKNSFVYARHMFSEEALQPAELALIECRVELWGGFVFVNWNKDAPSLREQIGPMLDNLGARNMDTLRAEWWYATDLPANWKVAMEAFMEGYHVLRTHPQLHQATPAMYNQRYGNETGGLPAGVVKPDMSTKDNVDATMAGFELLSEGMAGMLHAKELEIARGVDVSQLPEDPVQGMPMWFGMVMGAISQTLKERGENVPDLLALAQEKPVNAVEYIFPHLFLLPTFTSFSAYRIRPTGPETCRFEIWSLTQIAEGTEHETVMTPTVLPYDSKDFPPIPQQDYENIPLQQIGLHADGFEYMRLSRTVEGLISNYNRIIDGYLRGEDKGRLAAATTKLGGNFDGPILELGLSA